MMATVELPPSLRTQQVLKFAVEEARQLRHQYVGTEHLLLGLIRDGEGVGVAVLQNLGADRDKLRDAVTEVVQRGDAWRARVDALPYTSRSRKVLDLARQEAARLGHSYVGTEHLLLGLLAEGRGLGGQVLQAAGLTLDAARAETGRLLGSPRQLSIDPASRPL
jgi:ATP-dependent Clp protease ATP-binding subunit ClpC